MNRSLLPHFELELEQEFQVSYFDRIRPTLRILALLLAIMFAIYTVRDYADTNSLLLSSTQNGAPTIAFFALFGLTWARKLDRSWQLIILAFGVMTSIISLGGMAHFLAASHPDDMPATGLAGSFSTESLFFGQQVRLLMVCFSASRLQFRQALTLHSAILLVGASAFFSQPVLGELTPTQISRFLQPTVAIFIAVLLAAFIEEQLARKAFLASHLLEEERNDERRQREQTEEKLHVLAQAIGGIVHDIGNPLTMIKMGASTLDEFIDSDLDKKTLKELTSAINSGAEMLVFLRLSLIEQTRVLEGKATPVDLKPVAILPIIEAGLRFQKPYAKTQHKLNIDIPEVEILADEMKLITVFMNFIGNALKYSEGEIKITARRIESSGMLLVAVMDSGKEGQGITHQQAASLFTAFGRLSTHSQIEGTGLGLLSVQKIVEAHGGEAFIEGYVDGTPESTNFSTARQNYPSLLTEEFRTAFVVSCPLA
ncbi:HAMP domain-containing histidine kinase [bacterium]|nr:MAG: HAMP domain-containing histidine kinase [bacterium]